MEIISRITTQKKHKHRYNIFLKQGEDEAYGFSVDEDILIKFHLHKGMELDDQTKQTLIQKDALHKTYTLALHFLSFRMRSKKEIAEYLSKKEVDIEEINVVVQRLEDEGLLDDREFAIAFVRTRMNTTSKGPMLIKRELMEKGVRADIADEALTHYPFELQVEKASKLVDKKLTASRNKSFQQQIIALKQNLMQKGFSGNVLEIVMEDVQEQKDEDAEWDAIVLQGEKIVRKFAKKASGSELKYKVKGSLYQKGFKMDEIERFLETIDQE
ncbi:recombination regulator RecX [Radiobacillus sp. PE A8.2]|uniref:recombination regulator RecX n=1 Tax=Radiobacillus sp. PE A8.2 TaxID=3380349 RepID=UPI00388F7A1A